MHTSLPGRVHSSMHWRKEKQMNEVRNLDTSAPAGKTNSAPKRLNLNDLRRKVQTGEPNSPEVHWSWLF